MNKYDEYNVSNEDLIIDQEGICSTEVYQSISNLKQDLALDQENFES
jgi:hypothetical protein